jgi:hypothetical protein
MGNRDEVEMRVRVGGLTSRRRGAHLVAMALLEIWLD